MKQRQVLINAGMSVLQIIVLSGILFFLYRFLLQTLGVEKLGIWSLVLASTSISRVANLGLSGSVVKFVAKYAAHNDHQAVSRVLQTTLITIGLIIGLVLIPFYPLAQYILGFLVDASALVDALSILPFALLSVWLTSINAVISGGLDGYQRIDLRSSLLMGGMIFYALLCVVLVKSYGLIGLALAQVIQYIALLLVGFLILRRYVALPLIPYQWDSSLFREMLNYGLNFQVITLSVMLYDPITKALLSRLGGLAMVGYYEMASRMVLQLRGVVVAANQVLVPAIADLTERSPSRVREVYLDSTRIAFFVTIPLYTLLAVMTPIVSVLWIGFYEPDFVMAARLLTAGWFVNTLAAPAYFAYLGHGNLKWNTVSHLVIALLNVALGWFLGTVYGGVGVLVGWVLALIFGSLIIIIAYHLENNCSFRILWSKANVMLLLASGLVLLATSLIYTVTAETPLFWQIIAIGFSLALITFWPLWKHPVRMQLQNLVGRHLFKPVS